MSLKFLKSYLTKPREVGAVWPSSPQLCEGLVSGLDWSNANYVAEYGPGTGVVTPFIQGRLNPNASFLAVEKNSEFCQLLRQRYPQLDLVEGSVERIVEFCRERNFPQLDIVICGLPWASFPESLQDRCLDALFEVLKPGGEFSTFAYTQLLFLPAARRFRKRLSKYFSEVKTTRTFWRNVPPALVYQCRR